MDKITLPGAILLAVVGILPGFAQRAGVTQSFASFYGGTSLLIMVALSGYSATDRNPAADASVTV
jgi:preprotein translocase subunit SecY